MSVHHIRRTPRRSAPVSAQAFLLGAGLLSIAACSHAKPETQPEPAQAAAPSRPDPRVGLRAGQMNAAEAVSNLRVLARVQPPPKFLGSTNSDLAFTGNYAIQGNYNGFQIWDITNPSQPTLKTSFFCPASQSDVSTYKNLLFVSGEGTSGRIDCGAQGVTDTVSKDRLRGIRIFDITDIANPKYIANVQTCRGSHTHTLLADPRDPANVYIYVSGSAGVRPAGELAGCVKDTPDKNSNSALFRIEVIKVPLANPAQAAIVASPRIFNDLVAPPKHGETKEDIAIAKARGGFVAQAPGREVLLGNGVVRTLLDSIVKARNGTGAATGADSAALHAALPAISAKMFGTAASPLPAGPPAAGPTQCHDITVYPALGWAGGACEGYGLLLDIKDPAHPVRIGAVSDSNFSYWHSATFNNDGTKVLFSDEWGGGGAPKCRSTDPKQWGADALFDIVNGKMVFQSYYKLPAPQTSNENCVAHNGSLIPIPGRDVMVQSWYQGGISVFDWTDTKHPKEIASFDRGPVDSTRMASGGTWSVYWYNGAMVSSEISRGLDVVELIPSEFISQNEIDAAKTVHFDYLNAQGQPKLVWPPSFALARSFVDQLERNKCLSTARIASVRAGLSTAEKASASARRDALSQLSSQLDGEASKSCDAPRVKKLSSAVKDLASVQP